MLDVVVRKCIAIAKVLASKDKPLLIWWGTWNVGLDLTNTIRNVHLESDANIGVITKICDTRDDQCGMFLTRDGTESTWRVDSFLML